MVTPAAKRQVVAHACAVHGMSERRPCRILGVDRSSVRYRSRRPGDAAARQRIRELAGQRRRFGYRRLHLLLAREGWLMNQKRFHRLYRVRRRSGRKRALGVRAPLALPCGPNERWSLDFASDCFADGRRFRILAIVDDFTRESLALARLSHTGSGAAVARRAFRAVLCRSHARPLPPGAARRDRCCFCVVAGGWGVRLRPSDAEGVLAEWRFAELQRRCRRSGGRGRRRRA